MISAFGWDMSYSHIRELAHMLDRGEGLRETGRLDLRC